MLKAVRILHILHPYIMTPLFMLVYELRPTWPYRNYYKVTYHTAASLLPEALAKARFKNQGRKYFSTTLS